MKEHSTNCVRIYQGGKSMLFWLFFNWFNSNYSLFCIILIIARIVDYISPSTMSWFIVQILGMLVGYPV